MSLDNPLGSVQYITVQEIAECLGLNRDTVTKMIRAKEIPGVLRAVKPYRVSRAAFLRWVQHDGTQARVA